MSEIIKNQPSAVLAPSSAVTPMELLEMAREQGAAIEVMERLFELQIRWRAEEERREDRAAKKAYYQAMAEFKKNAPKIIKNAEVDFTSSKGRTSYRYASLDYICDQVVGKLADVGISHKWIPEHKPGNVLAVTCLLTHADGFSDPEPPKLEGPRDESGNKNFIQGVGSTQTFLQRYTLLAAVGLATGGQDTDGRTDASVPAGMSSEDFSYFIESIEAARTLPELKEKYDRAYEAAQKVNDKGAVKAIIGAKDRRKKEVAA